MRLKCLLLTLLINSAIQSAEYTISVGQRDYFDTSDGVEATTVSDRAQQALDAVVAAGAPIPILELDTIEGVNVARAVSTLDFSNISGEITAANLKIFAKPIAGSDEPSNDVIRLGYSDLELGTGLYSTIYEYDIGLGTATGSSYFNFDWNPSNLNLPTPLDEGYEISLDLSNFTAVGYYYDDIPDTQGVNILPQLNNYKALDLYIVDDSTIDYIELTITTDSDPLITNFSVTALAGENGSVEPSSPVVYYSPTEVTLTATPEDGYVFSNWTGDITDSLSTNNPVTLSVSSNTTITANFVENVNDPGGGQTENSIYLSNNISVDTNLVAENNYYLDGLISVLPGSTLSIEPGTIIRGLPASETSDGNLSALFILPGARIIAKGTAENPIIFTGKDDNLADVNPENFGGVDGPSSTNGKIERRENFGMSELSRWGGLYLLGNAFVDEMGTESIYGTDIDYGPDLITSVGLTSFGRVGLINTLTTLLGSSPYPLQRSYDPKDNSGELEYISIRYTGDATTYSHRGDPNYTVQPAALTLYGVGSDTSVSNIEVFNAGDDAFLLLGGSVQPRYLAAFIFGDECFEMECGWSGKLERIFGYGIINSNEFIEVSSYPSGSVTMTPSYAQVSFATYIGLNNQRGVIVSRGGNLEMKNSYLSFYEDASTLIDPLSGINVRPSRNRFDVTLQDTNINIYGTSFLTNSSFYPGDPSDYDSNIYGISPDCETQFSADVYSDNYALVKSLRFTQGAYAYGESWTNWMIGYQYLNSTSSEYVALTLPQEINYTGDSDSDGIPDNYDLYEGLDDALFRYYLHRDILPNYTTLEDYQALQAISDSKLTMDEVKDGRIGSKIIEITDGQAEIKMTLEQTDDITDWSDANTSEKTFDVPVPDGSRFYRFKLDE
jgi:hypothetical protein